MAKKKNREKKHKKGNEGEGKNNTPSKKDRHKRKWEGRAAMSARESGSYFTEATR